ncbi:MAG: hypothetical protein WBK28_02500 [Minisyncoccia bacterium]
MTTQQNVETRESFVGNMIEAALTYAAGIFWYGPITALLVFGPWEWRTTEEQFGIFCFFVVLSLLYDSSQRVAANTNIQAKFVSKTLRLFVDMGASAALLLIPLFMGVLSLTRVWTPEGADGLIAGVAFWFALNDLLGNSNMVHTALRRMAEYIRDR